MNAISITGPKPGTLQDICYDSRDARRNSLFVAIRGGSVDGHDFIKQAVKKGATSIVVEKSPEFRLPGRVTRIIVPDTRVALAQLADYYYDSPSMEMKVVGVTGTNGKTTISYLLRSIFSAAGSKCGGIGTIDYDLVGQRIPASHTTPESLDLQRMMRQMVDNGAGYCALEVSSHALSQKRIDQTVFRTAVFTNLTQDHLDYHGNMEDYFQAKAALFTGYSPEVSVINQDDPWASRLIPMLTSDIVTYGLDETCDVTARNIGLDINGISMEIVTPSGSYKVSSGLTGKHNIYNILAAAGVAWAEGMEPNLFAEGVAAMKNVPGRFEKIEAGQPFTVIVDYAHTDDALANALGTARDLTQRKLVTVFGCGGDRDKGKRPLMGAVAWRMSDSIIVTSDNPRTEDPVAIIDDVTAGINKEDNPDGVMKVVRNRSDAIAEAVNMAMPGDIVVIAGKGHEDYQIIGTKKIDFDDREEAVKAIRERYGEI